MQLGIDKLAALRTHGDTVPFHKMIAYEELS